MKIENENLEVWLTRTHKHN